MKYKLLIIAMNFVFSASCKSQSILPFSDLEEIRKGSSILSTYTCDDLIEKSNDKNFSLKNLAALRALAKCPNFKFSMSELTENERKIYSSEVESFNTTTSDNKNKAADLSIKELRSLIKIEKNAETKLSLYKNLRAKIKKSDKKMDFLKITTQMHTWAIGYHKKSATPESSKLLYETTQIYSRTFWTEGQTAIALKAIHNSLGKLKTSNTVAELYFLLGRITEEQQDFTNAVMNYDLTLADIQKFNPEVLSFNIERLMWLKSWILYKQKNYVESEKSFQALSDKTIDLSEKSRAQFYRARSLKYLNRETEAKNLLEQISQNDFFGYYGLVSFRELNKKMPALNQIKSSESLKFDLQLKNFTEIDKKIFIDLIKYREFNIAEKAITTFSKSKDDDINLSLYLALKGQIYMPLFRQFSKLNNTEKLDTFMSYPDLLFPQPYRDQVSEMSNKTKLPTSLIYSIMKQESAFNERARSSADAIGLMQVIPGLAKQLSRKFEVPYRHQLDLYDPRINIQIGSYELMEQVRKQNGQLTFVAAAYNAGPGALSNWLKNRKRDDVLEFIEEIPYDETKTYVKLIARNKLFYERISDRDVEHQFPLDFLN